MGARGKVAALAMIVCCGLVASAIALGMRVPDSAVLAPLPHGPGLDYASTFSSDVAPLRRDVVRQLLGLPPLANGPSVTAYGHTHDRATRPHTDAGLAPAWLPEARVAEVHAFTNDRVADARVISAIPYTASTDTHRASREPSEPSACSSTGGTAWYRFRAPTTDHLIANTFGTDHAVHLGIFEQSDGGSLTLIDCDADVAGAAFEQFVAEAGATYLFQIASQTGGGRLTFNLEPVGHTSLVSRNAQGHPASPYFSERPTVSDDGRYVAFTSYATNLHPDTARSDCGVVPLDRDGASSGAFGTVGSVTPCPHVYVLDRITGGLVVASVSSAGKPAQQGASSAFISGNGRYVAFVSYSPDLVVGDTNQETDVFVHDLVTRRTERVVAPISKAAAVPGHDQQPQSVSLSVDGRYVAFSIRGDGNAPGDRSGPRHVVVYDRAERHAQRVPALGAGAEANGDSYSPSISPNGRLVFFISEASNLVGGDTNGLADAFVLDRPRVALERVSVSSSGQEGNGRSEGGRATISGDGRYVAFTSEASNLVPGDANGVADVFVRDRLSGTTSRVSISSAGQEGSGGAYEPSLSRDGRFVAFTTSSNELGPGGRRRLTHLENTQFNAEVHDLYVRDLMTATTTYIPVNPRGELDGEATIRHPFLAANGRTIAFEVACVRDFSCGTAGAIAQVWAHDRPWRPA